MSIDLYPTRPNAPSAVLAFNTGGSLPGAVNSTTFQALGPTLQAFVLPGRTIKVSLKARMVPGAAGDVYKIALYQDGVFIGDLSHSFAVWGWGQTFPVVEAILRPTAGPHTYTAQIQRETGSGSGALQNVDFFAVEDVSGGAQGEGPQILGYAYQTSNPSGFVAETDVPGCTMTLSIPAGRVLRITGRTAAIPAAANDEAALWLSVDGVHVQCDGKRAPFGNDFTPLRVEHVVTLSPGAHVFKLSMQRTAGTGGTLTMSGTGTDRPGFIAVEDITGTEAPSGSYYEATWTDVASFTNSWVNYDVALYTRASYRKVNDLVYVRGLIRSGTVGQSAFTLPAGYRPQRSHHFACVSNNILGTARIQADGLVVLTVGDATWFSLDGIVFGVG